MEQFTSEDRKQIKSTLDIVVKIDTALRGDEYGNIGLIKTQKEHSNIIDDMYPTHLAYKKIISDKDKFKWIVISSVVGFVITEACVIYVHLIR